MNAQQINAFEDCLSRIETGEDIEQALERYPRLAEMLRPMLQAAAEARALRSFDDVPAQAQSRSRAAFLGTAGQATRPGRLQTFFRRRAFGLALAGLLALVLFATGITTAQATPGNPLYPVKLAGERAQMALTSDPLKRLELEEDFEDERVDETRRLLENHRSQRVELSGLLNLTGGQWRVDNLPLALSADMANTAQAMEGYTVYLRGEARADGLVYVERLRLRLFELEGVIQQINSDQWLVSRVPVYLTSQTRYNGGAPSVGSDVEIDAVRRADGALEAVSVKLEGKGGSGGDEQNTSGGEDDHSGPGGGDDDRATPQNDDGDRSATDQPDATLEQDNDNEDHSGSGDGDKTLTPDEDDHSGSGGGETHTDSKSEETPKPDDDHSGSGSD